MTFLKLNHLRVMLTSSSAISHPHSRSCLDHSVILSFLLLLVEEHSGVIQGQMRHPMVGPQVCDSAESRNGIKFCVAHLPPNRRGSIAGRSLWSQGLKPLHRPHAKGRLQGSDRRRFRVPQPAGSFTVICCTDWHGSDEV